MKLQEIISAINPIKVIGTTEISITGVNIDSRRIEKGHLFIAIRGTQADGHKFIANAIQSGASVILCEEAKEPVEGITYVLVKNTENVAGIIATTFYGNPTEKLKLIGVTGTNGKTTIATLLYNMFRKMGHKCGLLSTVCNYVDGKAYPTDHTTPDPVELNQLLAQMVDAGCEYAFMECSSHAIAQKRIGGLHFIGGIFTNLTRDHLDYHKTFENYRDAKKAFFDTLGKKSFVITNLDDKNGLFMTQNTKAIVKTYSIQRPADFTARIIECHFEGMYLGIEESGESRVESREVGVQFIGKFNVSNLLAVYGAARMLGKESEEVLIILSTLKSVAGRLEPIHSEEGITGLVDYAHTPDALENVLNAIHEVMEGKNGQIITVCGCGGNRDKGKRPLMAQEAVKQSNKVIITSDNPRNEDPQDIINDMLAGLSPQQMKKVLVIADRHAAIKTAVMLAKKGDVILVAGKGHEDYQIIKGVKHHFDDREELQKAFSA